VEEENRTEEGKEKDLRLNTFFLFLYAPKMK
jgi:hypothetical protein